MKILIIEDEEAELRALKNKFQGEGFECLEAKDGAEGLRLATRYRPDLILLDLILPVMDGITMLKKLREDEWGKDVPVVILTNLSDDKAVTESIKNGVYSYLVKTDWRLEDVVKKVKSKLGM